MNLIVRPNIEREFGIVPELYVAEFREGGILKHSDLLTYDESIGIVRSYRTLKLPASVSRTWVRTTPVALEIVCTACERVLAHLA